jgi:purine-binding chemotaxis protein CheW
VATPTALAPEDSGAPGDLDTESTVRQFVSFGVAGELFAVPLTLVHEIIRYPDIVRVPLGAPSLEGLGNLRGTVLPILSLRRMLGAADVEHDDATRVVVLNADGRPVGLVVDRMANVVTAEPDRIESTEAIRSAIATDLLTGVIKNRDGESMVMILDTGMLIRREFPVVTELAAPNDAATPAPAEAAGNRERAEQAAEIQLVSFAVAGQEYALPIEAVQEIVQIPPSVTTVPNSGAHVLGVMTLRNRLLPLVSLRRMFNLPDVALSESNKIVVVTLGNGVSVGIVTDSVREVLRVSRSVIDAMPEMLTRGGNSSDITSICRLAGGTRLVSILSAARMFDVEEIRQLQSATDAGSREAEQLAGEASADTTAVADDEEQLVVFRVMQEEYAVPIESVQEIVRVPDELIRIPKTPDFIEGVVNLRGAVLPVLDQRRRFGLPAVERNDRQRIVVFAVRGMRTGFIVDSVSQVMRVPAHLIGRAPELSDEQRRLIRRVVNLAEQKRMILMLEVDQLLNVGELSELVAAAAA